MITHKGLKLCGVQWSRKIIAFVLHRRCCFAQEIQLIFSFHTFRNRLQTRLCAILITALTIALSSGSLLISRKRLIDLEFVNLKFLQIAQ